MLRVSSVWNDYIKNYSGLPVVCIEGMVLTLINSLSIGICFFISLYFVDVLHFDVLTSSFIISFYGLGTVFGGIIGGKLSDKISAKIVSVVSLFLQCLTFFILTKCKIFELLSLDLFLLGMAAYGFKASNNVCMLNNLNEEIRLKALNISHAASNLGLGLSGIIIGFLTMEDIENLFYFSSACLFLAGLYVILNSKLLIKIIHTNEDSVSDKLKKPISDKKMLILILLYVFSIGLIISQLGATYPMYIENSFPKWGVKGVSFLFILDTMLIVFFQASLINILRKKKKLLVVGIGALCMGSGMMILTLSSNFLIAILSCIVWTTGEMLFVPMSQLVCYEKGGEKKKGESLGLFQAVFAASTVVGPTIGGMVYRYAGGNALWYLSAFIGFCCFISCSFYRNLV